MKINDKTKIFALLGIIVFTSGCISTFTDNVPNEEQLNHLKGQLDCFDKSIDIENYNSQSASIQNTGEETIEEVQLNWNFEEQASVNRTITNLEPGQVDSANTNTAGDVASFDASIVECVWK